MSRIAVIGLGTMGAGICAVMARAGNDVVSWDINPDAIDTARDSQAVIGNILDALDMPVAETAGSLSFAATLEEAVEGCDLVLENVPEKIDLKREVFQQIACVISDACILASDTSGIPISKLQAGMPSPERIVGMHWSNPPHIIPMIEVIPGSETAAATVDWMVAFIRSLNMLPVKVDKDVPGFVENRILYAIMREAVDLVERGVIEPKDLDTCVSWGIGYKLAVVGPMALLDMAGLDIYKSVSSYLNADLCNRDDISPFVSAKTDAGDLGLKSGSGIFSYKPDEIAALRAKRAKQFIAVRKALESSS
ncbi:MAG: 3-hydroxyacyl-CoA dehydrogenase NAD-binding domain-containing protein [Alphaproteobacteria bacterium]